MSGVRSSTPEAGQKKPASKLVKAWACGWCNAVYRETKHAKTSDGRAFADACCTCTVDGCPNVAGRYIGGRGPCEQHRAEEDLARAQENYESAREWLRKAQRRAEERR